MTSSLIPCVLTRYTQSSLLALGAHPWSKDRVREPLRGLNGRNIRLIIEQALRPAEALQRDLP